MSTDIYAKTLLKISVSQMLQTIGFRTAQSTALDILVEILERYIHLISRSAHDYSEFANRTTPTLDDVARSFAKHKINISDLEEFINWVDTPEFALVNHIKSTQQDSSCVGEPSVATIFRPNPKRPAKSSREALGYCDDPNNKELAGRESDESFEYVYDYFPLMTREQSAEVDTESAETEQQQADLTVEPLTSNVDAMDVEKNVDGQTSEPVDLPNKVEERQSEITKNGVVYENNTYNSVFKAKFSKAYYAKKGNQATQPVAAAAANTSKPTEAVESQNMSVDTATEKSKETEIFRSPQAKQNTDFHKPRLENYEKKIFMNAMAVLKKTQLTDADMLNTFKTKSTSSVSSFQQALVEEMSNSGVVIGDEHPQTGTTSDGTQAHPKLTLSFSALKNMKPSAHEDEIELGEIKKVRQPIYSEPTDAQLELMDQEEQLGNEIAHESSSLKHAKIDKLIQDVPKTHSSPILSQQQKNQPSIKLKIKDNTVMDSASSEQAAEPTEPVHFNLVIKKNSDSSSSVVVKQPQQQQQQMTPKPSIPKLKITNKTSSSFSLENFFPATGGKEESKKPILNLKQTADIQPVVFDKVNSANEGLRIKSSTNNEYNFNEDNGSSTDDFGSQQHAGRKQNMGTTHPCNLDVDENAIDSSMFNLKKSDRTSGTSNSMGNRNEPLIWKPVFNTDNTSNSNSEVSNDIESKPSNTISSRVSLSPIPSGPPPLTTFSTQPTHVSGPSKAKSSTSHFKAIVDYSSNSNESNASSCPQRGPGTAAATGDKEKQSLLLSPGKGEAAQSELREDVETLVNSIDGGNSSNAAKGENKKKKKKKEKSKDKDKDKKHKKKDKEKQQADDNVEAGGADESSSKKRDKRLKKELKRQKKLQKLAMAGLKPDGDGLESSAAGENKPDLDSDSSNDEEEQARSAADLPVAGAPVENTEDQTTNEAKPHLSLKISKGNLVVKSEANVKQGASSEQSSDQPRLPKLKLKIGGNEIKPSTATATATNLEQQISNKAGPPPSATVKPIKISLNKPTKSPLQQQHTKSSESSSNLAALAANIMSLKKQANVNPAELALLIKKFNLEKQREAQTVSTSKSAATTVNEDEPELGEVVRPKPSPNNLMTKQQMLQKQQRQQQMRKSSQGLQQQHQQQGNKQNPSLQRQKSNPIPGQQRSSMSGGEQVPKIVIKELNKQPRSSSSNPNRPSSSSSTQGSSPSPSSSQHNKNPMNLKNPNPSQNPPLIKQLSQQQQQLKSQQSQSHQLKRTLSLQHQRQQQQQQQQQQKQQNQNEQEQLANLVSQLPLLQSLGLPNLSSLLPGLGDFPFSFPPIGIANQFTEPNLAELIAALSQQQQQPATSSSHQQSSFSNKSETDSSKTNMKKRKHTEFEQQHQQQQNPNRSFTKSPNITGQHQQQALHRPQAHNPNSSFNRNKSNPVHPTSKQQQHRPITPISQQGRSITPTAQLGRSFSNVGHRSVTPNSQASHRSLTPNSHSANRSATPTSQLNRSITSSSMSRGDNNTEDGPSQSFSKKASGDSSRKPFRDIADTESSSEASFNQMNPSEDQDQASRKHSLNPHASNNNNSLFNPIQTSHQFKGNQQLQQPGLKKSNSKLSNSKLDKIISTLNKSNMSNQSTSQGNSLNSSLTETSPNHKKKDSDYKISPTSSSMPKKQKLSPFPKVSPQTTKTSPKNSNKTTKAAVTDSMQSSPLDSSQSGNSAQMKIVSTVVHVVSNHQVWICPWCSKPDDTVPMIGCDSCDDWYHWHCVGINSEPPENQNWYCHKCGNTDNPNSQTKQAQGPINKEHNLINIKKPSAHDEEADIMVEVEHPVETTDDE